MEMLIYSPRILSALTQLVSTTTADRQRWKEWSEVAFSSQVGGNETLLKEQGGDRNQCEKEICRWGPEQKQQM